MTSYQIEGPWPGRLAIIPRPRGGEWLEDEARSWKAQGFDVVVSLLTRDELNEFDLANEADIVRSQEIQFCELSVPDLGVPKSLPATRDLVDKLHDALEAGKTIAIDCRQGIGRSGLITTAVLMASGFEPELAMHKVSAARGLPVPETPEQREWVKEFGRELAGVPVES